MWISYWLRSLKNEPPWFTYALAEIPVFWNSLFPWISVPLLAFRTVDSYITIATNKMCRAVSLLDPRHDHWTYYHHEILLSRRCHSWYRSFYPQHDQTRPKVQWTTNNRFGCLSKSGTIIWGNLLCDIAVQHSTVNITPLEASRIIFIQPNLIEIE